MHRFTIQLSPDETEALLQMAREECRPAKDQIRYIIRNAVRREDNKRGARYAAEQAERRAA